MRDGIQVSEAIARDGAAIFRRACWMDREGIVSKRIGSRYVSGGTRAWLKTKTKISCGERQVLDDSSPIIDLSSLRNKAVPHVRPAEGQFDLTARQHHDSRRLGALIISSGSAEGRTDGDSQL